MSFQKERDFARIYESLPPDIQDSLYFAMRVSAASLGIMKKKTSASEKSTENKDTNINKGDNQ